MIRIVDVEYVERARAVIGEVQECPELFLPVHENRMHPAGDAIGELCHGLGVGGVVQRADHDAVLPVARAFAGEHEEPAVGEGHHVVDASCVRDDRVGDDRMRRIADIERIQHVAPGAGTQVRVLAVLVEPHFFRAESRAGQASDEGKWPAHVAFGEGDRSRDALRSERGEHRIVAGLVAHERTIVVDRAVAG